MAFTLQQEGKKLIISHAPQNPTLEFAESIIVPKGVNHIVSVGGGSTIDVGKWLAFKYKLKHTAIPTTAGTGSEVTKYCVLTTDGKKKTYDLKEPDSYVLNPSLVVSLPPLYTLSSGLDALSQAMEAHWSTNATEESRNYSAIAIELAVNNLKASLREPKDEKLRMNMLLAANFSGKAINITRTNVCHAISYPLTELYNIPHGIACAMSLPYFADKAGLNVDAFFMSLVLPKYEIDREKVAGIVMSSEKLMSYPHPISKKDIIDSLL